jgi:hypothetical protein
MQIQYNVVIYVHNVSGKVKIRTLNIHFLINLEEKKKVRTLNIHFLINLEGQKKVRILNIHFLINLVRTTCSIGGCFRFYRVIKMCVDKF